MSEREISLFERRTEICYCVPNGASQCAPCRERTIRRGPELSDRAPCPNCGNAKHWYRDATWVFGDNGSITTELSISGGHCLVCNYIEEAVYSWDVK